MKTTVVFALMFFLASCSKKPRSNSINKVYFYYFFNRPIYEANPGAVFYITFSFYEMRFKKCSDSIPQIMQSIDIVVPETDSLFSLASDSKHSFTYSFKNGTGQTVSEKINNGEIEGILVSKGLWRIRVKTKHFDFKKLIFTNERKQVYFEQFTTCASAGTN